MAKQKVISSCGLIWRHTDMGSYYMQDGYKGFGLDMMGSDLPVIINSLMIL